MQVQMSAAVEDYLKAVFLESERVAGGRPSPLVTTTALAQRLGVSAASATNMIKKLDSLGLVCHVPYRGAELTLAGRRIALEVVRHHRLLETYLARELGVPWDEVHAEAEILEHVLSEGLEERIADHLGHPTLDPHGHPIPNRDLELPETSQRRLWEAVEGEQVVVERVSDAHPNGLRHLAEIGIIPGVRLRVLGRGPVEGPLYVALADPFESEPHALSRELARAVWVA
jgi:DtxR family transcriptional regulator, Mn-dependent transcriptional regulator